MKGKFIVIVGPSASGKTELVSVLVKKVPGSARLITMTTRPRRPNETHEKDYFFITKAEFEKRIEGGDFFEYAEVYGNLYGSSKKILDSFLQKFKYVFAIIDVQGAQTLKSKIKDAHTIFIRPGSIDDIRTRLIKVRKGIDEDELKKRIETAEHELSLASTFDAVVDNKEGRFDDAVESVMKIISSL